MLRGGGGERNRQKNQSDERFISGDNIGKRIPATMKYLDNSDGNYLKFLFNNYIHSIMRFREPEIEICFTYLFAVLTETQKENPYLMIIRSAIPFTCPL